MSDPLDTVFDTFADATETQLLRMTEEIRGLRGELETQRTEIRSLRDELQTRSAPQVIEGPPGPAGKDGEPGPAGPQGPQGERGEPGAPSTIPGPQGPQGERGADSVIPGPQGERGEHGADGIASREELESIVEARFADLTVRSFADAYEGVWKEGLHKRGVFTTWGGSLWLSLADTENKPGENGDWRLVVKKGADAKR